MNVKSTAKLDKTGTHCRIYIETTVDGMKLQDLVVVSVSYTVNQGLWKGDVVEDYYQGIITLEECRKQLGFNT